MDAVILSLLLWAVGLFILYWVIRMAVRHGISDADHQRWRRREDGKQW